MILKNQDLTLHFEKENWNFINKYFWILQSDKFWSIFHIFDHWPFF